jgi:hypothetical protein
MRMLVFEGTVQEIKELQREFMRAGAQTLAVDLAEQAQSGGEILGLTPGRQFVNSDVALRFLTRRPLSKEQRAVIVSIYNSGSNGILATDIQREISYSPSRFAGLMGAFGRRLVNTEGYMDYTWAFDNRWETERQCNRYRFPRSVREAVEGAGLV